jgi:hypothetical protein
MNGKREHEKKIPQTNAQLHWLMPFTKHQINAKAVAGVAGGNVNSMAISRAGGGQVALKAEMKWPSAK